MRGLKLTTKSLAKTKESMSAFEQGKKKGESNIV